MLPIEQLVARARALCPDVSNVQGFAEHLTALLEEAEIPFDVVNESIPDVFVAFAAAHGDTAALLRLDAALNRVARPSVERLRLDSARVDEVLQRLRVKLTVGDAEHPPKLLGYAGSGPLEAWLRVAAIRSAYNFLGEAGEKMLHLEEAALATAAATNDLEIEVYARRYALPLHEAMRGAVRDLEARERAILRFHLVEGLSIDQLGVIYQVHRSTVARWIQQTKSELAKDVRKRFCKSVGTTESDFFSILKDIRSYLDFSVERALAGDKGSTD